MATNTTPCRQTSTPRDPAPKRPCIPLDQETRVALPTGEAAWHMNRSKQTLRLWACYENGPIRPLRINRRLAWPVADLRRLLGVTA